MGRQFVEDLLVDPTTRDVYDLCHHIAAVASSSSVDRAQEFIKAVIGPRGGNVTAYGNYESLAKDPTVDIIYIATPTSLHYQNVTQCLNNGKHVLCEVRDFTCYCGFCFESSYLESFHHKRQTS
jgi:dihydrodiol dehydrogenase / D-xylose 1-dehydrogenase (NADP)